MQYKRRYKGRKIWCVRAGTQEQRWHDAPTLGPVASIAQRLHRDLKIFLNYFYAICQSSRCFSIEEHPSNPIAGLGLPRNVWEPGGGGGGIALELHCHTGTHRPCSWQMYIESNLLHICLISSHSLCFLCLKMVPAQNLAVMLQYGTLLLPVWK